MKALLKVLFGGELTCVDLIMKVGDARSSFIQAIHEAKAGNITQARELVAKGKERFAEGHRVHTSLIQKEAAGEHTAMNLLLVHSEDQLMSAETFSILCTEFIDIYERIYREYIEKGQSN